MEIQQKPSYRKSLLQALVPTKLELFSLTASSLILLFILNALSAVKDTSNGEYVQISEYLRTYIEKLLAPTESEIGTAVFTFMFWMVIGILSYLLIWMIATLYISYKNDAPWSGHMILPRNFSKIRAGHEVLTRFLIRTIAIIALFCWTYLLLTKILPNSSSMFLEGIIDIKRRSILKVIFSVLSLASSFFIVTILTRLVVLRTRVFELD